MFLFSVKLGVLLRNVNVSVILKWNSKIRDVRVRTGLSGSAQGSEMDFLDLGNDPSASTRGIISFVAEQLFASLNSVPCR
jgi:hypothetical protein